MESGIIIDWQAMAPDSPAAELEVVAFSPPLPLHTLAAARARAHADRYDDGGAVEFANNTDQKLQDFIKKWEGNKVQQDVLGRMPDGGKKVRERISRMKKELERRRVTRNRKDDRVKIQAAQAKSTSGNGKDLYAFNPNDDISDCTAGKFYENSNRTKTTKTYTQVKATKYKEQSSVSHGKGVYLNKDGRIAKDSDRERLNTDICRRNKSTLRSCTRNPQKSITVDSKSMHLEEDATLGSNRRWNHAKDKVSASIEKDVVLLDDDEPARSADFEIFNNWDESKIYYPSRMDPDAVELAYSDMKCLEPEGYLKSPVINFYLEYLKKSRPRRDLYMFNTYFYSKLEEALSTLGNRDSQFSKLRRWCRNVDIFKKAYIILPINETMHWSLIIVCMPTKGADSGPMMLHLDSLGLHSSQKLFDIVASYLEAEWQNLRKDSSYDIPFSRKIWERLSRHINGEKVEVPRQRNEYDCGLFMLYYIEKFIQQSPENLTKERLGMFGRKWFNHEEASRLREGIQARLFDLFQSAREDDGPSEPEWHPGDHSGEEDKDADTVMATELESSEI